MAMELLSGPTWISWRIDVYVELFTGLLGPAQSVVALAGTAIPQRIINGEAITVEADDNTALLLDHGNAVYSVIQAGFVYAAQRQDWTVQLIGTGGAMTMGGYAWEPKEVSLYRGDQVKAEGAWEPFELEEQETYVWQSGATYIAECLAQGEKRRTEKRYIGADLVISSCCLLPADRGSEGSLMCPEPCWGPGPLPRWCSRSRGQRS